MMPTKICAGCAIEKDLEAFNFKQKSLGTRQIRCRDCTRKQVQSHYSRHKEYYVEKAQKRAIATKLLHREKLLAYLSFHPCVDCGETDFVCLEFDHVCGEKQGNIAEMFGDYAWEKIEAEIAKCDVRCANCHRRKTAKQYGYWNQDLMIMHS
jgi:hypothetical protein